MSEETDIQTPAPDGHANNDPNAEARTEEVKAEEQSVLEQSGEEQGDEGQDEGGERRKPSGYQRLKRRTDALLAENAELYRRIEESSRRPAADGRQEAGDEEKPPREEDFKGDYFAYERALTAHEVRKAVRADIRSEMERQRQEVTNRTQREVQRERNIAYSEALEEVRASVPDFDETMIKMRGVNVREELIDEITSSPKGPLIAYELAKNPSRLAELSAMTGRELAREIGRLEASVKIPMAKRQTTTPAPMAPLKGGSGAPFDPFKADMDAYAAAYRARKKA